MSDALPNIRLNCPDLTTIAPGHHFLYRAKVGGERRIINVVASTAPYPGDFGKGRKTFYVDIFSYGWKGTAPAKKLRIAEKV